MTKITKQDLVAARQKVHDAAMALEQHAEQNVPGLTNEQMVDVELKIVVFADRRDVLLSQYKEMLRQYHAQELQDGCASDDEAM